MMRQKIIIGAAVLILLIVIGLMVRDMFHQPESPSNPYEYKLDEFKKVDQSLFCYREVQRFSVDMEKLSGIAVDMNDNIYLSGLNKILIYNKLLEFKKELAIEGEAKNISVAENGLMILGMTDHIEIWDTMGIHTDTWEKNSERSVITSIAFDDNQVYVADAGKKLVLSYDWNGNLLGSIGGKDTSIQRRGFIIPSAYFDVAIGREGQVWAVNSGMHALEAFNPEGELISTWHKSSMDVDGFSGCCNPSHIGILDNGSFVTSEKGLVRVKIHEPDGRFKCMVAGPDEFDEDTEGLDIAVNSNNDIFLIVPGKKEVRKYISK